MKKKSIGLFLISLLFFSVFWRCVIDPPVYYYQYIGAFRRRVQVPVKNTSPPMIDIYKLVSELIGISSLMGIVYLIFLREKK